MLVMLYGMYNKYELAFITVISTIPVVALLGMCAFAHTQGVNDRLLWVSMVGSLGIGLIVFGDSLISFFREFSCDRRVRRAHSL